MIHVFGQPDLPVPRLIETLARRGHPVGSRAAAADQEGSVLVLGPAGELDPAALGVLLGAWRKTPRARVLMLSLVGAHPDARAPRLSRLWELEEHVRGSGLPVLTLRFAPLIGAESPLWLRLRSRPRLPRGGRSMLNPVVEADAIETIERALDGRARWEGWYEVAGREVVSLGELESLARGCGPSLPGGAGAWEPSLEEMMEQRLCEADPWCDHFGLTPRPVVQQIAEWAA